MDKKTETSFTIQPSGRRTYSEALKHLICKEYMEQGSSYRELVKKYQLSCHTIIYDWLRKLGYVESDRVKVSKSVYIGIENYDQMPIKKEFSNPPSFNKDPLQAEITRLKRELLEARIQAEGYQRMIELAEAEHKISIRKKDNTK